MLFRYVTISLWLIVSVKFYLYLLEYSINKVLYWTLLIYLTFKLFFDVMYYKLKNMDRKKQSELFDEVKDNNSIPK